MRLRYIEKVSQFRDVRDRDICGNDEKTCQYMCTIVFFFFFFNDDNFIHERELARARTRAENSSETILYAIQQSSISVIRLQSQ